MVRVSVFLPHSSCLLTTGSLAPVAAVHGGRMTADPASVIIRRKWFHAPTFTAM